MQGERMPPLKVPFEDCFQELRNPKRVSSAINPLRAFIARI